MHLQIIVVLIAFAAGAAASAHWLTSRPEPTAEAQRIEALACWHEVAVNRRLGPGECRFL